MPTYEFSCGNCGKKFSLAMTFAARDKGGVTCPKCRSRKVAQRFTAVFTMTARKS